MDAGARRRTAVDGARRPKPLPGIPICTVADARGRSPRVIRNQQVSGSSPLVGSTGRPSGSGGCARRRSDRARPTPPSDSSNVATGRGRRRSSAHAGGRCPAARPPLLCQTDAAARPPGSRVGPCRVGGRGPALRCLQGHPGAARADVGPRGAPARAPPATRDLRAARSAIIPHATH